MGQKYLNSASVQFYPNLYQEIYFTDMFESMLNIVNMMHPQ